MPKRTRSSSRGFKRRRPYRSGSRRSYKKRRYTKLQLIQPNAFRVVLQRRAANYFTAGTGWSHLAFAVNQYQASMANWDKYSAMYGKYRVDQYRISFMVSQVSVGSIPIRFYMWADDKATVANETEALARPYVKCRMVPADNSTIRVSMVVKPWTVLGITKQHYLNDDYYAATTAPSVPSKICYIHYGYYVQSGTPGMTIVERHAQLYKFYDRAERTS